MKDGEAGFVTPPFFSPSFLFLAPDEKDTSVRVDSNYRPDDRRAPPPTTPTHTEPALAHLPLREPTRGSFRGLRALDRAARPRSRHAGTGRGLRPRAADHPPRQSGRAHRRDYRPRQPACDAREARAPAGGARHNKRPDREG